MSEEIASMKIDNGGLKTLLKRTARKQFVGGKPQDQVIACLIKFETFDEKTYATTTSLVRDGKTSLSHFRCPCGSDAKQGEIPIPDIDRLLGVLAVHGSSVNISYDGKLRIKSGTKQTTLTAQYGGLAFPHSTETIKEWADKSSQLSQVIHVGEVNGYKMRSGEIREPFFSMTVAANAIHEATRCDAINNQRLNRYRFKQHSKKVTVSVGQELKGATETILANNENGKGWEWAFEGGFEHIVDGMTGEVKLHFIDFRPENQGIRVIMDLGVAGWVYQAGLLEVE